MLSVGRSLFDFNKSFLVLNGKRSTGILNKRGLLQGSSLSPILFNMFINRLLMILDDLPKMRTRGISSNCLFFADDANLHAMRKDEMLQLLKACEKWSIQVGMKFAPTKCFVISKRRILLSLYGEILPQPNEATYLGFEFNNEGIEWNLTCRKVATKAKNLIMILTKLGLNANGWTPRSCIIAYKSFIRPIFEYILKLGVLPKTNLLTLQRTQNLALRNIFTVARTTSLEALHRICLIETVETRNAFLSAKFAESLHNSNDGRIPAVRLWRNIIASGRT
jgi:hypothetical protein